MGKYVFGTSLAGLAFMAAYSPRAIEFPAAELRDIVLLGAVVHTVPFVAALVWLRSRIRNAVLALIVLGSVATAHFIHTDLYLTGSRVVFWLCALAVWGGVFAVFEFMDENRRLCLGLPAALALALAIWVVPHVQPWPAGTDRTEGDRFYAEQIRPTSFEATPNVYFIAFDGLAPQAVIEEHLDIETTDFIDLVDEEFRRLPNMFAESRWSVDSLSITASLHRDIFWEAHGRDGHIGDRLTGEDPNPLYDILHDNGYETNFGYHSAFLGRSKGPHVDNLFSSASRPICWHLGQTAWRLAFWGYCNLPVSKRGNDWATVHHSDLMEQVIAIADRAVLSSPSSIFDCPCTHRAIMPTPGM